MWRRAHQASKAARTPRSWPRCWLSSVTPRRNRRRLPRSHSGRALSPCCTQAVSALREGKEVAVTRLSGDSSRQGEVANPALPPPHIVDGRSGCTSGECEGATFLAGPAGLEPATSWFVG